jgi:hypothetical protein
MERRINQRTILLPYDAPAVSWDNLSYGQWLAVGPVLKGREIADHGYT